MHLTMRNLADYISIEERFARSVNLDRDFDRAEPLDGYILTERAIDVLQSFATRAASGISGGAWSLTGPYGAGKSSLAILINSAFGPPSNTRDLSWQLIQESAPEIIDLIEQTHKRYGTSEKGFYRGLVTANQESVNQSIFRALHSAVIQRYGKIPPASQLRVAKILKNLTRKKNSEDTFESVIPTALLEVAKGLANEAPLLLIIDEFGKNLEAIREDTNNDPYLLQQIAELGQSPESPIFFLTLQHQSYEDYFEGVHTTQRREWSKVQGRFEEISYVETSIQSRKLIASTFRIRNKEIESKIDSWARTQYQGLCGTDIGDLVLPEYIAACYPLHPITALILPELCSRFGQHERTMFSFLTSGHSSSVATFLQSTRFTKKGNRLPSIGLDMLYDFFVAENTLASFSSNQTSRWIEIVTRLRDVQGLSTQELALAKSIAILNLVSSTGSLRASQRLLSLSCASAKENLSKLISLGLVNYRSYADDYRIWQGTDIKIEELIANTYEHLRFKPLVEVLREIDTPAPTIAARHSAQFETLRIFSKRYIAENEKIPPSNIFSPYDGEIVYVVGTKVPSIHRKFDSAKPVIAVVPNNIDYLSRISQEVAAILSVLEEKSVNEDWVARRELEERLAQRQSTLNGAIHKTYSNSDCRWLLLHSQRKIELPSGQGSAPLSAAADQVYRLSPMIRNETINRTKLSTQGAKARRILLEAMIKNGNQNMLGLTGYGPEVAIYKAVLQKTGIHRDRSTKGEFTFGAPRDESISAVWKSIRNGLNSAKHKRVNVNEIFAKLLSPPIGMKLGVIPVVFTATLLAYRDRIAIYEHGTFKPLLTADLSERMVKNPSHFDIKHFANTEGGRYHVIRELEEIFGIKGIYKSYRVSNVLSVVNHLVSIVRSLNRFALKTQKLSQNAIAVRDCLLKAVEPDNLIFDSLPEAVELPAISADERDYEFGKLFAQKVHSAFEELSQCFENMIGEVYSFILQSSREPNRKAISGIASSLEREILNPEIRAFTYVLAEDNQNNLDWAKSVATVVSNKAPNEWSDNDVQRFRIVLAEKMGAFRRLVALHVDHRTDGRGEFHPLRIVITAPDGSEFVDTVSINNELREGGTAVLDDCLNQLKEVFGSSERAQTALFALLSENLLSELCPNQVDTTDEEKLRTVNSG